jgi:hypothetical protein
VAPEAPVELEPKPPTAGGDVTGETYGETYRGGTDQVAVKARTVTPSLVRLNRRVRVALPREPSDPYARQFTASHIVANCEIDPGVAELDVGKPAFDALEPLAIEDVPAEPDPALTQPSPAGASVRLRPVWP